MYYPLYLKYWLMSQSNAWGCEGNFYDGGQYAQVTSEVNIYYMIYYPVYVIEFSQFKYVVETMQNI